MAFHKKAGLRIKDMVNSNWVYRKLRNFRTGHRIGHLVFEARLRSGALHLARAAVTRRRRGEPVNSTHRRHSKADIPPGSDLDFRSSISLMVCSDREGWSPKGRWSECRPNTFPVILATHALRLIGKQWLNDRSLEIGQLVADRRTNPDLRKIT